METFSTVCGYIKKPPPAKEKRLRKKHNISITFPDAECKQKERYFNMKKTFKFEEVVKHVHTIEVDVDEQQLDAFEHFAEEMEDNINFLGNGYGREMIAHRFAEVFGEDKVTFVEDGSPTAEYSRF